MSENKQTDALSKIASTSFAYLTKQVLVEVLKEKSISEKEILVVAMQYAIMDGSLVPEVILGIVAKVVIWVKIADNKEIHEESYNMH
ncbi:hypothetical protein Tco_0173002 [Tanacetum coccineum]